MLCKNCDSRALAVKLTAWSLSAFLEAGRAQRQGGLSFSVVERWSGLPPCRLCICLVLVGLSSYHGDGVDALGS